MEMSLHCQKDQTCANARREEDSIVSRCEITRLGFIGQIDVDLYRPYVLRHLRAQMESLPSRSGNGELKSAIQSSALISGQESLE